MSPDPPVLAGIALLVAGYLRGTAALSRGRGRSVPAGRSAAFVGGVLALAVALLSPLDTAAERLFVAHMTQHMLLILVAAPLLVLGAPGLPLLLALPPSWRRPLARWRHRPAPRLAVRLLTRPLPAWGLHVGALWIWHLPGPYQAALASTPMHALEHVSFLGTAWLFWAVLLAPGARRRLGYGAAILYVFVTALPASALGALLSFAPVPLYPLQAAGSAAWRLTALQDQQFAGLVMWVPADIAYLAAAATLFLRWFAAMERTWQAHQT